MLDIDKEFELTEEVENIISQLSSYLKECYECASSGNSCAWIGFCRGITSLGFDKDLRLISNSFMHTSLNDYIKNKSLQRKSYNAMKTIEPLLKVLHNSIPPTSNLFSSLGKYMSNDASNFIIYIGEDIKQFLLWLDYRTKGSSFICKMKNSDYKELRKNISVYGEVYYVNLLLRAIMAYKSIVLKTQSICDKLNVESGIKEKERLVKNKIISRDRKIDESNMFNPLSLSLKGVLKSV